MLSSVQEKEPLAQLLREHPQHLWRAHSPEPAEQGVDTGFARLNAALPYGGWPKAAVVECQVKALWEAFSLWLPSVARFTQAGQWVVLLCPPLMPYAPALKQQGVNLDNLQVIEAAKYDWWVAEKLSRLEACGLLLGWLGQGTWAQIQRLQRAAVQGNTLVGLFHAPTDQASPAALRLRVQSQKAQMRVQITKARGTWQRQSLTLALPH